VAAVDTNVLLRLLLIDDEAQRAAALALAQRALAAGEVLFVPVTVTVEIEWVLRARYGLAKAAVIDHFGRMLEAAELYFQFDAAVEHALSEYAATSVDFADCLHAALAAAAGESPLWTFDRQAARTAGIRLLPT
jgi:predicted nucleic-acid-binding protein